MRKEIDAQVQSVKDEFVTDLNSIAEDISELTKQIENRNGEFRIPEVKEQQLFLNITVRNVVEKPRENVKNEVNRIIKDGTGICEIEVSRAERMKGSDSKPGVIIATFKYNDDKKKVMERKKNLKSKPNFSKIFSHHDQSRDERKTLET